MGLGGIKWLWLLLAFWAMPLIAATENGCYHTFHSTECTDKRFDAYGVLVGCVNFSTSTVAVPCQSRCWQTTACAAPMGNEFGVVVGCYYQETKVTCH